MVVVAKGRHHQQQQQQNKAAAAAAGKRRERRMKRLPNVERVRLREREQQPQCGDVAGGTAAGCATVFVCLPLAVVELVVLATVRVPTALCVHAVRSQRLSSARRKDIEELVSAGDAVTKAKRAAAELEEEWGALAVTAVSSSFAEGDTEDWAELSGAGFWRSSPRYEDCC